MRRLFFHGAPGLAMLMMAAVCSAAATSSVGGQEPAAGGQVPAQEASPAPAAAPLSGLLQPSLDALKAAVDGVKLDKWKGNPVRTETAPMLASVQRDLLATLPALMTEADNAPGLLSKTLPVSRNVGALYDVVLRVVDSARTSAPSDQFASLQQALQGLDKARHAYDEKLQDDAAAQETQLSDLRGRLKAQAAVVCPAPPPAPAATPAKKPVPKKKKKPVTPAPAGSPPAAAPKPS